MESEIANWKEINDESASALIEEVLNHTTNDELLERNMTALEKRYKKPTGTISEWIFYDDITDGNKILEWLKKDTIIRL